MQIGAFVKIIQLINQSNVFMLNRVYTVIVIMLGLFRVNWYLQSIHKNN